MNDNYFKKIFALIVVTVFFPFNVAADTFLKWTIETNEYFYEFDNFDQTLLQNGLDEIEIISVTPIKIQGYHQFKYNFGFDYDNTRIEINRLNGDISFIFLREPTKLEKDKCLKTKGWRCDASFVLQQKDGHCRKTKQLF